MYVNRVSFVPTVALLYETAKNSHQDLCTRIHTRTIVYISHINRVHLV